ncbi:hypothetical protein QLR68_04435, partial [Micromonospora sp. DH15]|nr:hypothetical protein [Micromonospora sp. DH15]
PQSGALTADTNVVGLTLFGAPAVLVPNTPGVTASAAVVVPGLTEASLTVTLTAVEETTADTAAAVAVLATVQLTGSVAGGQVIDIPVGTVIRAEANCERPLAPTSPTATPTQPSASPTVTPTESPSPTQPTQSPTASPYPTRHPHLPVTGDSGSSLWWTLGLGTGMVTLGTGAVLAVRRSRRMTGA